LKGPTSLM